MSLVVLTATRPTRRSYTGGFGKRAPHEFYPTPPEAVRALLSVESFDGSIWERACGDGAIAKVLDAAGYDVRSTDLVDYGFGQSGVDFLMQSASRGRHIVTNPPYGFGLADQFVEHALQLTAKTGGSVAMLLNLSSLCHRMRHDIWVENPPAAIYALDELTCWPCGDTSAQGFIPGKHRYCWVVWRPGHVGRPTFWWLRVGDFRAP